MNIECSHEKFKLAISQAEKIAGKHMTLPVLSCVLFDVNEKEKDSFLIRATNLDLGIEIKVPAKLEGAGRVAVPASPLSSFVSSSKNSKNIKIELQGGSIDIFSEKNKGSIKTMDGEDFPKLPEVVDGIEFEMNAKQFTNGLKSVWYSASVSGVRPELSSVYVYCDQDHVVFVATDSFRLAEKKVQIKKSKDFGSMLIPHKNIPEIIRIFENYDQNVQVCMSKNQLSIRADDVYLISRVIDGTFPDYRQIIPKAIQTNATILKQDLINALKSTTIFADKLNQVGMHIFPNDKKFVLHTKNNDIGEVSYDLEGKLEGESLEITFNHRYVMDSFQSINTDSVELHFSGLNKPLVIKPHGDGTFLYLVMPMNR